MVKKFDEKKLVSFFLRSGLAVVFLYAGLGTLLNPISWTGFIPAFLRSIIPASIFLPLHVTLDLTIGLWLLSGQKKFYAALFASLSLFTIVLFNIKALDIIFRDVALLFSAIALIILHLKEVKVKW